MCRAYYGKVGLSRSIRTVSAPGSPRARPPATRNSISPRILRTACILREGVAILDSERTAHSTGDAGGDGHRTEPTTKEAMSSGTSATTATATATTFAAPPARKNSTVSSSKKGGSAASNKGGAGAAGEEEENEKKKR